MHFGVWDLVLIAALSLQALVVAYVHSPQWKVFVLVFPLTFTFAFLAVGSPVNSTNVWGLVLVGLFTHGVRMLHYDLRMPIILAIVISALGYCVVGVVAAPLMPTSGWFFWTSVIAVTCLALIAWATFPRRVENGSRTELPFLVKLPAIVVVVVLLLLLKNSLQGFTTVFPMLGVIAAYEARGCLWTMSRAVPAIILGVLPMIATIHLTQDRYGLNVALAFGVAVFLCVFWPVSKIFLFGCQQTESFPETSQSNVGISCSK